MLNNLIKFIQYTGVLAALFSLVAMTFVFIIRKKIPQNRENFMKGLLNVFIGMFIIGSLATIVGYLLAVQDNVTKINVPNDSSVPAYNAPSKEKSTFALRFLAEPLDAVSSFILGDADGKNGLPALAGFESLDNLIFNQNNNGKEVAPFTNGEWRAVVTLYNILRVVGAALFVIMVGKTGILITFQASKPQKLAETYSDFERWAFVILIIATGLIFTRGIYEVCGWFSDLIYDKMATQGYVNAATKSGVINAIKTGNVLATAIVKFMYAMLILQINVAFMARKWVLIIMTASTPVMVALWGINKKVQAFDIWFGEIITNAAMGVAYAITFSGISLVLGESTNIIFIIIGISMAIRLADVLRNSLQGIVTRMSGVNELNEGLMGMTQAGRIAGGMMAAFGASGVNPTAINGSSMLSAFKTLTGSGGGGKSSIGDIGSAAAATFAKAGASAIPTPGGATTGAFGGGMRGEDSIFSDAKSPATRTSGNFLNSLPSGEKGISTANQDNELSDSIASNNTNNFGGVQENEDINEPEVMNAKDADYSTVQNGVESSSGNAELAGDEARGQLVDHQKRDNRNLNTFLSNYKDINNVDGNQLGKSVGNTLGFVLTSGNPKLSGIANSISTVASTAVRVPMNSFNMAKALWKTTGQIATRNKFDDPSYNEENGNKVTIGERKAALKELLGGYSYDKNDGFAKDDSKKNDLNTYLGAARLVAASGRNNPNQINRVLMKNHVGNAFNKQIGFNGWNDIS